MNEDGGDNVTGPLANEFAQVRKALVRPYREVKDPAFFAIDELPEFEALAKIEEHTHNTEKALREARLHLRPEIGGRFDQRAAVAAIDAALSAGEGTPR